MAYALGGGVWDQEKDVNDEHSWIETLDGDISKLKLVDKTPDGGTKMVDGLVDTGRPLKPDHMPTRIRRGGAGLSIKPLLDFEFFFGGLLVSEKVKEVIEEFEPGRHQFFPMELFVGNESHGTFFFLVICNRLDTMDEEHTFPLNPRGFFRPKSGMDNQIVLSSAKIGKHHLWQDKRIPGGRYISDPLAQQFRDEGFTGMSLIHHRET